MTTAAPPACDSLISFSASYTGVYYIDVGAWDDDPNGPGDYTGNYQVSVTSFTPPVVGTNDQIANQLTNGYWGGSSHHFNVTPGRLAHRQPDGADAGGPKPCALGAGACGQTLSA